MKSSSTSGVMKDSVLSELQTCHPPGNTNSFLISRQARIYTSICITQDDLKGLDEHTGISYYCYSVNYKQWNVSLFTHYSVVVYHPYKILIQLTCLNTQSALIHWTVQYCIHVVEEICKITCNFLLTATQSNPFVRCILWHL